MTRDHEPDHSWRERNRICNRSCGSSNLLPEQGSIVETGNTNDGGHGAIAFTPIPVDEIL